MIRAPLRSSLVALAAASVLASTVSAAPTGDLRRLFPSRAAVSTQGPGWTRLSLPPDVLAACRPDLSDLRLLREDGTEVPYVIARSSPPPPARAAAAPIGARITAADRRQVAPGHGPVVYRESYTLEVPPLPRGAVAWRLRFAIARPEVVCRLDVVAVEPGGGRRQLVSRGSVFRLERPRAEQLVVDLPPFEAPHLEVLLEGENGGWVEPVVELEAVPAPPAPAPLEVPLRPDGQHHDAGRTVVTVLRPRGLVPSRLRIGTSTPSFLRRVTVVEEGPEGERIVGEGQIYRIEGIARVESLDVPLKALTGDRLRIEIQDGDSPPLEAIACSALVPGPVLLFQAPDPGEDLALYFGGARTHRPRYDLEALGRRGTSAGWDPSAARPAVLGEVTANPLFDPAPALGFLMRPGSRVDVAGFSHRRTLRVRPSPEGLSRLELTPEDLSRCRPDLGDLRIVDGQGRQWPYLLAGRNAFSPQAVGFRLVEGPPGHSTYRLDLPASPLEIGGMTVDGPAPFFDRAYRVVGRPAGRKERVLAQGRLRRLPGSSAPVKIPFGPRQLEEIALVVDDGGDAPLEMSRIAVGIPRPALYFPAPAGTYALFLGNPGAEPPRYEISAARSIVLGVPAATIEAGPLEPNPEYSPTRRLAGSLSAEDILLWVVLILAVVVLATLTLRHARQEGTD